MPGEGVGYYVATSLISIATLVLAIQLGQRKERAAPWVMGAALLLLVGKAVLHWHPEWETALFPFPAYVYFQGYWIYPIGLAVLGIGVPRLEVPWNRAVVLGVALAFLAAGLWNGRWMVVPIDDSSTRTADAEHHCRQTRGYTCAPASCVMLLSLYGVTATEGEMARNCLTTSWGTTTFDIYRGLLVRLEDSDLRPQVLDVDLDELRALGRPAIVGKGPNHAIVVQFDGKQVRILDPLGGGPSNRSVALFREDYDGPAVVLDRPPAR